MTVFPPAAPLDDIREELLDLDSPHDRLEYLIELGSSIPDLATEYQTEEYRVLGCQSMVWVVPHYEADRIYFGGTSDAPMVRGLVAILLSAYSGKTAKEIVDFPVDAFFNEIHLKSFLTPMRSNGLHSMVLRMQSIARSELERTAASNATTANTQANVTLAEKPSGESKALPPISIESCRADFPLLSAPQSNGSPFIYLDNAASSQRPQSVIDCMSRVYEWHYSNVHRSGHELAAQTTELMEAAREAVRAFIHAKETSEIIFTSGTTASINLVARAWGDANLKPGDEILLTEMEHHSNIVPWQQLAERTGAIVRWLKVLDDSQLDLESLSSVLSNRTKLVSFTSVSNVLGTINPVRRIVDAAHSVGAKVLVDAAQAVPHGAVDVTAWDADWVAFSGHKMLGPTGIGALYGKRDVLESMPPFLGGGNMIKSVSTSGFVPADLPHRFEAGTAPIVETIAMTPAIEYLSRIGSGTILMHERMLLARAQDALGQLDGVRILGPDVRAKTGVLSFVVRGIHADQIGQLLNLSNIAIRVGHHCAMPLHERFGIGVSSRASFYFYNTTEEVDQFVTAVDQAIRLGRKSS